MTEPSREDALRAECRKWIKTAPQAWWLHKFVENAFIAGFDHAQPPPNPERDAVVARVREYLHNDTDSLSDDDLAAIFALAESPRAPTSEAVAELLAACEPFAEQATEYTDEDGDDEADWPKFTVGQFRALASAVQRVRSEG